MLCDYSNTYIFLKGRLSAATAGATVGASKTDRNNKQVALKNCALFTDCITEVKNIVAGNAKVRCYNVNI